MDRNDRSIVGFLMVAHLMVHVYELSIPILMTIWLLEFSTTAAVLGAVVAVGYGLFGIGALPGGVLVDRYGSHQLVVACLAGMGLSFLVVSVADGIVGLTVALALWGLSASVYHPAGLTLVSNGVVDRGRGFAYHGMAGNVGIAGGPFATALLLLVFEWETVAVLLAIPALVAAVVGLRIRFDPMAAVDDRADGTPNDGRERDGDDDDEGGSDGEHQPEGDGEHDADRGGESGSDHDDEPDGDHGRAGGPTSLAAFLTQSRALFTVGFTLVFVVVSMNGLYYRGALTFLPDLLGDFLSAAIGDVRLGIVGPESPLAGEFDLAGYLYAGLLTVGIGGQYLGGRLTERIEPDRGLIVMLSTLAVIALLFVPAAGAGLAGLLLVSVALGFTLFAMQPLTQATIAKYSFPESRGLSFGYTYLSIFGIGALGAAITGAVLTYGTVSAMFVVLALIAATGAGLAVVLVTRQ